MIVRRLPLPPLPALLCAALVIVSPLASRSAGAAEPSAAAPDSVVVLPGVRVDRDRVTSAARRRAPTAFVTELSPGTRGRAFETLGELLAETPGAHVQQYGGLGAFSTVSLRGAPASQVALFIDGVPLQSGGHAVADLAVVPFSAVERVEVYRGGSPLALGVAGAGGAINLVTLGSAAGTELRVVRGSFDTWETRATTAGSRGPLGGMLHAALQRSAGDFSYLDDNGTPFNAADDSVHARANAGFEALTLLGSVDWRAAAGGRLALRQQWLSRRQGVPGLGAVPALATQLASDRALTQLEATLPGRRLRPDLLARADLAREWTRFDDPHAELGLGAHDTRDAIGGQGVHAELGWGALPLGWAAQLAADVRRDDARTSDAADGRADPPASRRDSRGVMASLEWHSPREWLLLRAASRWDVLHDALRTVTFGDVVQAVDVTHRLTSPQLGARLRLPLGLEARGNWSRAERAPEFMELFGNQGSVLGNATLLPERTETRDIGLAWQLGPRRGFDASASWAHFASRFENLILYVRNSQSSVRAQNVSSARIDGDEWLFALAAPGGLSLNAAYTHQRAIDSGPVVYWSGKFLPQRPEHEGSMQLAWSHGAVRAAGDLQWLGLDYLDRYNRYRVDQRRLLGASLGLPAFHPALHLTVEGKNLTDDRATDVAGFPLPGRSVFVALEARLGPSSTTRP